MRALALLLFLSPGIACAQFLYELDTAISVLGPGGTKLKHPWAGGLNAVQVNTMDLNGDALNDLVVFERMGDLVLTYVQKDGDYVYAPQYEMLFPEGITNWLLLRDFNNDGLKDIFTGDVLGIKVYINKTQPGGKLAWQPFQFFNGRSKSPLLQTKRTASKVPMQITYDDLPSIVDADGDGDLDIFVIEFPAASKIEYHQNFSAERNNGSLDSLDFERVNANWAGVRECGCGNFAFNNEGCSPTGREEHAGGKSLFAFDADNDGDLDMLFAEAQCDQLFLFENVISSSDPNKSNPSFAIVNSAVPYPETFSMVNFAVPYREDLDFDGISDLIVSPNLFFREFDETNFKQSVWFYKNTGTNAAPAYAPVNKMFLQDNMIDVGDNAVPAFFDEDGDGDLDMFIGCYINNTSASASLYFFRNTGTETGPRFEFVTDDYRSLSALNFVNLKPQFADMNGDGKTDLVFSAQTGSATRLYYIANSGTATADFSGSVSAPVFSVIWREENMHVTDVNRDGLPDLIVGKLNGSLDYYEHTGTPSAPAFTLKETNYLKLASTVLRQNTAVATGDLNNDGRDDLAYGFQSGKVTIISNYRQANDSDSRTEIVYNSTADDYIAQNLGGRIWPVIANLYGTPKPEIVVGNILGGVHILKHRYPLTGLPEENAEPQISVFPNPVSEGQRLMLEADMPAEVQLFTVVGQAVGEAFELEPAQLFTLSVSHLKGVYILRFRIRGKNYSRKIVIR